MGNRMSGRVFPVFHCRCLGWTLIGQNDSRCKLKDLLAKLKLFLHCRVSLAHAFQLFELITKLLMFPEPQFLSL
jgi:hypothetical protein